MLQNHNYIDREKCLVYLKEAFFQDKTMAEQSITQGCGKSMKNRNGKRCRHQDDRGTPLSRKNSCGLVKVCGVHGDRKHCARLAALGIYPGNEIELVNPSNGGECIIKVHGGTISFDSDTTDNIIISEYTE